VKLALARWRAAPDAPPPSHRPGALAARVLADLRAEREADGAAGLTARLPNGVRVTIDERVDRQFLMHTVSVKVAATACGPAMRGSARVRQTGWLRSTGIDAVAVPGCDPGFVDAVAALVAEPSLADALRCSRRTLQTSFQRVADVTPVGYLRTIRLNAVRRLLRTTPVQQLGVGEAAASWGFTHLGYFAREYRDLFGELPSQTTRPE
jgi:transcriptional regulator GlxA family with amidase domain